MKVHYVGYGSEHDEWRHEADIVPCDSNDVEIVMIQCLGPLLCTLSLEIKSSLL